MRQAQVTEPSITRGTRAVGSVTVGIITHQITVTSLSHGYGYKTVSCAKNLLQSFSVTVEKMLPKDWCLPQSAQGGVTVNLFPPQAAKSCQSTGARYSEQDHERLLTAEVCSRQYGEL